MSGARALAGLRDGFPCGTRGLSDDGQDRVGVPHLAYLTPRAIESPTPLRHVGGSPARGLLRGLRRRGARARQAIPLSRSVDVRARRRCPVRPLERPRWPPFAGRKAPTAAQFCRREPATPPWTWSSGGHVITTGDWGSGNPAFTGSRGSRGATAVHVFGSPPLYRHAAVPPGFR